MAFVAADRSVMSHVLVTRCRTKRDILAPQFAGWALD